MNIRAFSISLFILASSIQLANAEAAKVAKVVLMRGMVKAKLTSGEIVDVKMDSSLPEGATLQTAEKSFVKLIFIDKSTMNLGPNSQMVINSFPKKEAGIITLMKGEIKSQVTKDYMEMDDKSKSKLYIKTKTAAMGIRGTSFQVNFNPENQNTSLITFEGKVAMASIEKGLQARQFDQSVLENVVSSKHAVMVEQGQVSAVNLNVAEKAMVPTKLSPKQIQALESNDTGIRESAVAEESKKQFKNPIPPGADGAAFSNSAPELEKEMLKMAPATAITELSKKTVETDVSNPNGFFNDKTGEYKLPAGSIIDLSTVNIIPPPTNAVFDANSNTYVVPETYGKVDKTTGEYKAPEGLKLGVDGKFILVDAEAYQRAQGVVTEEAKPDSTGEKSDEKSEEKSEEKSDDKSAEKSEEKAGEKGAEKSDDAATVADKKDEGSKPEKKEETAKSDKKDGDRAPASVGPAAVAVKIEVPKIYDARPEMAQFAAKFAASPIAPPPPPPTSNTQLQTLATQVMQKTETVRQQETDLGLKSPTTKLKIIFDAQ